MNQIIARMSDFARTTKDDALSVLVSNVANRLTNQGSLFEKPLSQREIAIIRPFMK